MKNLIINKCMNTIIDINPDYNKSKLDEIRYGLEGVYLSLTKVIVILGICFLLGIIKEALIILLLFNGLRAFGFGIHASKSWMCWVSSSILFVGIPYLCMNLNISVYVHYFIIICSFIIFLVYAPADTKKRPLVRKHRRVKFKVLTIIMSIIYIFIFIKTSNIFLQNAITSTMLMEAVLIHPLTYRVFNLPYKNYESYVFSK